MGTIDTSPSSIRLFIVLILGLAWIYIFFHPPEDEEYQDLQNRINELREELEDPWEDDDDDDDGDIVVRV